MKICKCSKPLDGTNQDFPGGWMCQRCGGGKELPSSDPPTNMGIPLWSLQPVDICWGPLTDLYVSPETLKDLKSWEVEPDSETKVKIINGEIDLVSWLNAVRELRSEFGRLKGLTLPEPTNLFSNTEMATQSWEANEIRQKSISPFGMDSGPKTTISFNLVELSRFPDLKRKVEEVWNELIQRTSENIKPALLGAGKAPYHQFVREVEGKTGEIII